jgi:dihydrofolate synthase/folylpolyglutamate synthase
VTHRDLAYHEAVAALGAPGRFGIRLGLGRTRALLRELGDPHQAVRGVLIGGTNGKGSVQAMVASVLRAGGMRVGQTPKPHLVTYRERIVVDGLPIAPDRFASLAGEVLDAAGAVPARLGRPTEFELVTAMAFRRFALEAVDVAVVEVGLGGRLDATNAWDGGVAAITTVALDHMEHLGPTERHIGREKAAIIKRGDLAVTGVTGPGAEPIRRRARRLGVPLREVAPLPVERHDRNGLAVRLHDGRPLRIRLLGRHQSRNAAVALAILDALRDAGIAAVEERAIRDGLASVRWPGRLELLALGPDGRARPPAGHVADPDAPDLLLDGAHNEEGAQALATALDELRPSLSPGPPVLLVGMLADKDIPAICSALVSSAVLRDARVVATTVPGSPRTLDAASLATRLGAAGVGAGRTVSRPSLDDALDEAVALARTGGGPLVAAGSLYLVGAVRQRLVDDPALADPPPAPPGPRLSDPTVAEARH